jgi:hypothetical protein
MSFTKMNDRKFRFIFGLTTDCDDHIVDRAELEEFEDTKGLSDSVNEEGQTTQWVKNRPIATVF